MIRHFLLTICIALTAFVSHSQVVINEFSAANYDDYIVNNDNNDWVELYNTSGAAVDLSGYYLSDKIDNPTKYEIPAGASIPAGGFLVFHCSSRDEIVGGNYHTNFRIKQSEGESFVFADPSGAIIDSYTYTQPNWRNHSIGRSTDGGNDWVFFTNTSPDQSNNGNAFGVGYSPDLQFSEAPGYHAGAINLSITSAEAGVDIYYTTDGAIPNAGSTLYTGPISIPATTPIRAIAYSSDAQVLPSFIETNTYLIGDDQHTIPVWCISGASLSDGAWNGDELTDIEMFDENGNQLVDGHGDSNEHGNDSNAYAQRGFDYINRDEFGYEADLEYPIFSNKDRDKYQRLIFKAAANDNYPFSGGGGGSHIRDAYIQELSQRGELRMDERSTESCILYINGEYWGVYEVREKVDDTDFLDHYYDQPRGFVEYLKTWGGTWEEYGDESQENWDELVDFITNNDMTVEANYDYVKSVYNTGSLIDYFILNTYTVCADWLNWNTAWWRGRHPDGDKKKWRYTLWDMDNTFGYGADYTGIGNQDADADPCTVESMGNIGGQGHIPILNALFTNEEFNADYINRYADLTNTTFSCDNMIALLDEMTGLIAPEMGRQTDRWGGSVPEWEANVQELREYIQTRCADEIVGGIEDCYDVEAFTLTVQIVGIGEVSISTVDITNENAPWSGTYFSGLPIELSGVTDLGLFLNWEVIAGDLTIDDLTNPEIVIELTGDVVIQATFLNDLDPVDVMVDVMPAGGGDVSIAGNLMAPYPSTHTLDAGVLMTVEATPATTWHEFDHWELNNHAINPDMITADGEIVWLTTDTLVAVFNELEHYTLNIDVEPAGAGTIYMEGNQVLPLPWNDEVGGGIDLAFETFPTNQWFEFSHWELNNHMVTPDEFSSVMTLNLSADDALVAVYNEIPHYDLTILVSPPGGGFVDFNGFQIVDKYTETLEGELTYSLSAVPQEYIDFKGWSSNDHEFNPDAAARDVSFFFQETDTIVAHFDEQTFTFFIPTAFTPNNDNLNDVFIPKGYAFQPESYRMQIFNEWGQPIFESTDIDTGWTGDVNGGEYYAGDGVYSYLIEVRSVHTTEKKIYQGALTMFR